ncbi:hypothetical protein EBAPG3_013270 [Nitrosospira lacus]|uniref:Uncharacterized protein n=1 Tax=Nitrosospira lacus TaxID=1288494 RepID=A0A1W6SS90_9PROT|nr:hypothetical protein EBAPG3_013270 [Nitrosospira lacus]
MTDDLVEQIAAAVADRLNPRDGLWSAKTIAAYMDIEGKNPGRQVLERFAPHPGFPKAIRVPVAGGGRGHPRWKESEIRKWWERYKDVN